MKGLTLIEILVSASIFIILVLAIFAVADVGRSSWFTGNTAIELRQEIMKIFMRMEKELKETRAAEISLASGTSSSSLTFRVPQDIDGDGTILDSSGNIEWSGNITYALNGSNQITRTASGATYIIANNILSLQFSRPVAPVNVLQVDVTARKTSLTRRVLQDSGQIIIKMRN